jgi:hypothetical protein
MSQKALALDENGAVLEVVDHLLAFLERPVVLFIVGQVVDQIVSTDVNEEAAGVLAGFWDWTPSAGIPG